MPASARDDIRDKRQAILLAARELFTNKGYDETTIAEIARAARVAVGTVYLYFANKREIQLDVCLALNDDVAQVILSPSTATLELRQVPRAIIEAVFRKSRENMRFMWAYQVEPQTPAEADRISAAKRQISDALNLYFQGIVAQGAFAPFPTAVYAELLDGLVSHTLTICFGYEQGEREEYHREGLIGLIERLFFGPPLSVNSASDADGPGAD
jgi:AcrR family transcriptional regulator